MKLWQWSLVLGGVVVGLMLFMSPESPHGEENTGGGAPPEGAAPVDAPAVSASAATAVAARPAPEVAKAAALTAKPDEPVEVHKPPAPARSPASQPSLPYPKAGGPLAQLKQAYASSSAPADASEVEAELRAALQRSDVEFEVDSVICREQVCRVRMTWSAEQSMAYMATHMLLGQHFNSHIAVEPLSDEQAPVSAAVDIYVLRPGLEPADLESR